MRSDSMAAPTLEAKGIVKRFGRFTALKGVDLLIRPGEVTALAGPNGAGKTTLFHVLGGNLRPDVGRVLLDGTDVTGLAAWRMARRGVGRLFQEVRTFGNLTARENVTVALDASGGAREDAMRWLDYAGLAARADLPARDLSFSERKLLALARLMASKARLLLLDEPAAGLAADEKERVCLFIRRLADERRVSVALVEHDRSVVERFADTVFFLHEGDMLRTGPASEVFADERVRSLYEGGGLAAFRADPGRVRIVSDSAGVLDAEGRPPPDVAYLREEGNVFGSLTVSDNLALAGWALDKAESAARRARAYAIFPFLAERARQRAGTLSGGQRQALALAMTMSRAARTYFFDRPSAGLAPRTAAEMFAAIRRFAADNPDCDIVAREE